MPYVARLPAHSLFPVTPVGPIMHPKLDAIGLGADVPRTTLSSTAPILLVARVLPQRQ